MSLTEPQADGSNQHRYARVLLTGATGFIGRHLTRRLLREQVAVRCLVRSAERARATLGSAASDVELTIGGLDDMHLLRQATGDVDVVFHLAGRTFGTRRQLTEVNVQGTDRIAAACAQAAHPPVLVMASSLAAAGTAPGRPRIESDWPHPVSEYGRSKRGGEWAAIRRANRFPLSIVRPGIVFGAENREMLPMFRSIYRARVHAVPGFAPRRVSLIHVDDLIDLMLRVAAQGDRVDPYADPNGPDASGLYFASAELSPTLTQLGAMIAQALDLPSVLILHVAEPIAWLSGAANQLISKVRHEAESFNIDKIREAFAGDWTCSSERAERMLGFRPARPLPDRLRETAAWYRDQGWL